MQLRPPTQETVEAAKVVSAGVIGGGATLTLADVHLLVAIGVGCMTMLYIGVKIFCALCALRRGGKSKSD